MRAGMIKAVSELAAKDENVILLTGDVGFGLIEDFQKNFPSQHINTGIAEQNMIGLATGLSLEGAKVFVYSIGNFPIFRCLEQVRNGICYHNLNVTIVSIGAGFSYGSLGITHHATEDISVMRAMPNMQVFAPLTEKDAYEQTLSLYKCNFPSYIRLEKNEININTNSNNLSDMFKKYRSGKEIAIFSLGGITEEAIEACDMLKSKNNLDISVYGFKIVKPLDYDFLHKIISNYKKIITVEEHVLSGGFGSAILELAASLNLLSKTHFYSIGINNTFSKLIGTQNYLRKLNGLDRHSIYNKILNLIN